MSLKSGQAINKKQPTSNEGIMFLKAYFIDSTTVAGLREGR
jgi:hypothetical protein